MIQDHDLCLALDHDPAARQYAYRELFAVGRARAMRLLKFIHYDRFCDPFALVGREFAVQLGTFSGPIALIG